jgi:hypothetical protein
VLPVLRGQVGVDGEAVGGRDRRLHHLLERHRAVPLQRDHRGVEDRGHRRRGDALGRDVAMAAPAEPLDRRQPRRDPDPGDHHCAFLAGRVDQDRRLPSESEVGDLHDRGREQGGDARIHCVAALLHHADAGLRARERAGAHGSLGALEHGPAGRRGPAGRKRRRAQQQDAGDRTRDAP